jgi:methyl-accepting chemotaxis protein
MSIQQKIKVLYTAAVFIVIVLMAAMFAMSQNQSALNNSQDIRFRSHLLANELRQSSEDLTRLARTYVITGDAKYERMYWDIVAVRAGEKPRPGGRAVALRTLMQEMGFSNEELGRLKDAENNSNDLVRTETIALNAVKGKFDDGTGQFTRTGEPDLELARRVMHDEKYHSDKAKIMRPIDEFDQMLDARTKASVDSYSTRGNILLGVIGALVVCGCTLAFFIVRNVNAVLRRAIDELSETAQQVTAASAQVAATSQTLAEGASRQAAALEETSASADEIHTITTKNAESSKSAAELISLADRHVKDGDVSFRQMLASMSAISDSSRKIANIIKAIDEIAFQTNILALNAAVEAARAGEAGMGFSVVADEVRNLAHRASEAAKSTAVLIEESIQRTIEGTASVEEVARKSGRIHESISEVKTLVEDVSVSSHEQARGVEQISRAIADIQQVTQNTAAHAEESAAATEEISAQAQALLKVVHGLRDLVGGRSGK